MTGSFAYIEPTDIREACTLLSHYREEAKILAGGTDVLVQLRNGTVRPRYVISLHKIQSLKNISELSHGGLRIGALAQLSTIASHHLVQSGFRALREAILTVGSAQIQNMGTLAGNICNASPAADTGPPLLIFEARINIVGPDTKRTVAVEDFFRGPGRTVLTYGEIVESIELPASPASVSCYIKLGRTKGVDLALVSTACLVTRQKSVRLAFASVAPTPCRMRDAEEVLAGDPFNETKIKAAAEIVKKRINPISDIRASREYRNAMAVVLLRRGMETMRRLFVEMEQPG